MLASKLPKVGTTIFTRMSQLAADVGAINLSQGFPDFDGPQALREAVVRHVLEGRNQYSPMTGLPAQILGLQDRGRIAVGQKADVVVFDPETVRSDATYLDPYVFQEGMNWVLVNGRFVVDEARPTDELPGIVLERQRTGRPARPRMEDGEG